MPPPDTLVIPFDSAQTVLLRTLDSLDPANKDANEQWVSTILQHTRGQADEGTRHSDLYYFALVFFVVTIIILFHYIGAFIKRQWTNRYYKKELSKVDATLNEQQADYHTILEQFNPYYAGLDSSLQQRFLRRTIMFMRQKQFRFHSLKPDSQIALLVSGAAVQMTFGLKNYLLDYFPTIHIIRNDYELEMDHETYYGHVSKTGIYIAWNRFREGFADYEDGINVGLHEMAHAVSFDVFLGQVDRHDMAFRQRLEEFSEEGLPVFRAMRAGTRHLLDNYGATNFDEFWAVCAETFFENPEAFKQNLPDLYFAMAELLNQDPLLRAKIINHELAGD